MKTLSQLLIEADITPEMLYYGTKYIAQDSYKGERSIWMYWEEPECGNGVYESVYMLDRLLDNYEVDEVASDWETPLSIEDFKNNYDKHIQTLNEHKYYAGFSYTEEKDIMKDLTLDSLLIKEKDIEEEIAKLTQKRREITEEITKRVAQYGKTIHKMF